MIFVEPTRKNRPPTALLMTPTAVELVEGVNMVTMDAVRVSYSNDNGAWLWEDGSIVDPKLGQAITEHAKNLGVESFQ